MGFEFCSPALTPLYSVEPCLVLLGYSSILLNVYSASGPSPVPSLGQTFIDIDPD